jgi:hypothetical protein
VSARSFESCPSRPLPEGGVEGLPLWHCFHATGGTTSGDLMGLNGTRVENEQCCWCGTVSTTRYILGALKGHGSYGPRGWVEE